MDADQRKKKKKKRKLLDVFEEEESETEEAKMEKFYELIRVSKDIRARMMKINGERLKLEEEKSTEVIKNTNNNNNNMKKMKNVEREKSTVEGGTWNPTFKLEDFLEDGFKFHVNFPAFPVKISGTVAALSSNFKKQEEKAGDDDDGERREDHSNNNNNGLDLNLSL